MILYSTPSELITYVYDFSISMTHRQRRARIYFKQSLLSAALPLLDLCASGVTCAPLAHRLTNNQYPHLHSIPFPAIPNLS
jgi:hypothetical protein